MTGLPNYDRDLNAAMERHAFPDECQCPDPTPVSECCGAALVGLRCAECHDNAVGECATCERPLRQACAGEEG